MSLRTLLMFPVVALWAASASAESHVSAISAATSAVATTAHLNVSVSVPRILYLRVGTAGATVNTVTFGVGLGGLTVPTADAVYAGTVPVGIGTVTRADNNGASDGRIAVRLWTNNGTANLTCSGAPLTAGTNTLPLSAITVTSAGTGTLAHPGTSLACASVVRGTAGTNDLTDTWTYAFAAPSGLPAAGRYTTQVTYTASQP
jgi:hypothetical protein